MLYNYKLTLSQMGQIKNYKKDNKFSHSLLGIEDIELLTYEIDCEIAYKKTVPLNLFEKYSIRLIEKADEIFSEINVTKIAQLLHLDEKLIEDNLENLEVIGMLNGVKSDIITINRDEHSYYLQYENKFKIETVNENHHMTKKEHEEKEDYIKSIFDKNTQHKDKKYKSMNILNEKLSSKNVQVLNYTHGNFLILGENGINQNNDLKFIDEITLSSRYEENKDDIFCHYDEFLVLLRDKLAMNRDKIIVISSKIIEDSNLDILKAVKSLENIYILSHDEHMNDRVFNINLEDFVLFGDELYSKDNEFVVKKDASTFKQEVVKHLNSYFVDEILEISPDYNAKEIKRINKEINELNKKLEIFEFSTKREIENKIKMINEEKNKLYGLTSNKSKVKSVKRKEIDNLELLSKEEELKQYPVYLDNREKIFGLKKDAQTLENEKNHIDEINKLVASLNKEKSDLIPKDKKVQIAPLERELKNIQRLLHE